MSKKTIIPAIATVLVVLSAIFGAAHDFIPDYTFQGSSLANWKPIGHANWRAENGEIIGTPQNPEGGWLVMDKGYQDLELFKKYPTTSLYQLLNRKIDTCKEHIHP